MKEIAQQVFAWGFPLASIFVIVLAATRGKFPGKPWLMAYLSIGLAVMLAWRLPHVLVNFDALDFSLSKFHEVMGLPINIIGLAGFCMLIPFVMALGNPPPLPAGTGADAGVRHEAPPTGDASNPLYGVRGWLKLFVVVNMYISPVVFGIRQIIAVVGFGMLAGRYPGIVVIGLIEAAVGIFFIVKWIRIARGLRDIVPGIIQEAKKWLLISLAWNLLSAPLVLMAGMDARDVMPEVIKQLLGGIIGFAIWYTYFNVSLRVKATYPDWNKTVSI